MVVVVAVGKLWLLKEPGLRIFHLSTLLHFKVSPLYLEITDSASQMENKRGALRFEEIDIPSQTPTTTAAAATTTLSLTPKRWMSASRDAAAAQGKLRLRLLLVPKCCC